MRVRSLQTYIADQGLVNGAHVSDLAGLRVGVDAIYWLRTLPNLKDPMADAIGGLPLSAVSVLDTVLGVLQKWKIEFVFVFQGMQTRSHMLFTSQNSQAHVQMDDAWNVLVKGFYGDAQHRFAQATSRITSDFVFVVSRFLQSRGCQVVQAPYSSGAQLAYFAKEGVIDTVFGPPAWMLLGIERVIMNMDFKGQTFDWIDKSQLLTAWKISEAQLLDACLLAGTEYCLTFPYLNLSQVARQQQHHQHAFHLHQQSLMQQSIAPPQNCPPPHQQQQQQLGTAASSDAMASTPEPTSSSCGQQQQQERPAAPATGGPVSTPSVPSGGPVSRDQQQGSAATAAAADDGGSNTATVHHHHNNSGVMQQPPPPPRSIQSAFLFATAIQFVKQASLAGYTQHFPTEHMKNDHVDSYSVCRTILKYPLALHFDGVVRPFRRTNIPVSSGTKPTDSRSLVANVTVGPQPDTYIATPVPGSDQIEVPYDMVNIYGRRLPASVYCLMFRMLLGRKLPSVIALGEWNDFSHPSVDTQEYRDLLCEVIPYRLRAVGLLVSRLPTELACQPIRISRYACQNPSAPQGAASALSHHLAAAANRGGAAAGLPPALGAPLHNPVARVELETSLPNVAPGMTWNFTLEELQAEKARQGTNRITFRFCLAWHANELRSGRNQLCTPPLNNTTAVRKYQDIAEIQAIVHFRVLENLGYFTSEGSVTVFGSAIETASPEFEEDLLFALELMKCGDLTGDPLEELAERRFPQGAQLLRDAKAHAQWQNQILLLSRVASLVPMQLNSGTLWHAYVDFDLAAYHSCVKLLKKTLRHLSEACLASELLGDLSAMALIPLNALSPFGDGIFPAFLPPRNCLGIVMKYFLEWSLSDKMRNAIKVPTNREEMLEVFAASVARHFQPCDDPVTDLVKGVRFWCALRNVMNVLAANTDVGSFQRDTDEAHHFLVERIAAVGLDLHPAFQSSADLADLRAAVAEYITRHPHVRTFPSPAAAAAPPAANDYAVTAPLTTPASQVTAAA